MKNTEILKNKSDEHLHFQGQSAPVGFLKKIVHSRIKKAQFGRIEVTLPNQQTISHLGKHPGHNVAIDFKSWKSLFQYMLSGQLAFVEAYINGQIQISNLYALCNWFLDNEKYFSKKQNSLISDFINRFLHLVLNDNNREGSRKNISFHYDLGNDFYKKWLDETMTYSAGIFDETSDLRASQIAKYDRIIDQLELSPGDSVLEIGCGWGGFAEQAITNYPIDYHGITISKEQFDYAIRRLKKITVRKNLVAFEDYRDTAGKFDKIVSIEMFEAVGEKHWQSYFETIKNRLNPRGKAVIQVITIDHQRYLKYRNRVDFIQKYIFPGGMLPSNQVFAEHTKKAGLKIVDEYSFGQDYALTLRHWKDNFLHNWPDIEKQGFDQRFYRLWLYYLDYCITAFERGTIDVMHYSIEHEHA
ncbi:MAG: class I SAM-dependent methyltransferase [Alphaproteobacteria bacterium]|nr:class I SAM-dependent methyltransferase [Alphaproteobacteria bacterium]HPF45638.1 cyclopropane-fatty-acyl-phospholipid synthase family protein [Emcibacteraceae bacterium]